MLCKNFEILRMYLISYEVLRLFSIDLSLNITIRIRQKVWCEYQILLILSINISRITFYYPNNISLLNWQTKRWRGSALYSEFRNRFKQNGTCLSLEWRCWCKFLIIPSSLRVLIYWTFYPINQPNTNIYCPL